MANSEEDYRDYSDEIEEQIPEDDYDDAIETHNTADYEHNSNYQPIGNK